MFLARLVQWWRSGPQPALARLQVVMYTRRGCHLCEAAWAELTRMQSRYGFQLQAVDIDPDPRLVEQYHDRVPVVLIDGKLRFWGRVNGPLLRRLLDAEARRHLASKKPPDGSPEA